MTEQAGERHADPESETRPEKKEENVETLKEAREKRGIKLEAVAKTLGVTRQTYAKYEADQGEMSIEQAKTACEYIGVDVADIFFAGRVKK